MNVSRRDFAKMGLGKSAAFLTGFLGMGIIGKLGIVQEGSPEEAARYLAENPVKRAAGPARGSSESTTARTSSSTSEV